MKTLNLLGSTGSIGKQTLDVARAHGYKIEALAAYSDVECIEAQIREFKPRYAALVDEKAAKDLKTRVSDLNVTVLSGLEGVSFCGSQAGGEITLNSVVGMAGLKPTLDAVNAGKTIALANKETLVAGGHLVTEAAKKNGVAILPVDSEHSAIFQCLLGKPANKALKRIILTASGGPFYGMGRKELEKKTLDDALAHPTWNMGKAITIDSATLMNKGFEVIEAAYLFDVSAKDIDVLIHRESIIHSMVEYIDNSVIAQLSVPDMRMCINYALTYPNRASGVTGELDLAKIGRLNFGYPDYESFPLLKKAYEALTLGGALPAVLHAANEEAVGAFIDGKIKYLTDISDSVCRVFEELRPYSEKTSLEDVFEADATARERLLSII